ncbi:MAG: hypothetical protein K2N91_01440, partial [Muribaculaceae bacterium]|nr:hypothetical protein [Muribaculaceae bacterium]
PTEMRSRGLAHEAFNSVKGRMMADIDHILATPELSSSTMPPFHSAVTGERVRLGAYLTWWLEYGVEPDAKCPIQWGKFLYYYNRSFPTFSNPINIREIITHYAK